MEQLTMRHCYLLLPLILFIIATAYADDKAKATTLPVVNDINCKIENIKKIENKEARQAFAGLCIRRGEFVKSQPKVW